MDQSGEFSDEGLDEFEESVEDPKAKKKVLRVVVVVGCEMTWILCNICRDRRSITNHTTRLTKLARTCLLRRATMVEMPRSVYQMWNFELQ